MGSTVVQTVDLNLQFEAVVSRVETQRVDKFSRDFSTSGHKQQTAQFEKTVHVPGAVRKPFKVWSADRIVRKSLMASTLEELKIGGSKKLNYSDTELSELRVVTNDGSMTLDEKSFPMLEKNSVLLLLRPTEKYLEATSCHFSCPTGPVYSGPLRNSSTVKCPESDCQDVHVLMKFVCDDPSRIMLLNDGHLEAITKKRSNVENYPCGDLIYETCDRILLERQMAQEAAEVLAYFQKRYAEQIKKLGK